MLNSVKASNATALAMTLALLASVVLCTCASSSSTKETQPSVGAWTWEEMIAPGGAHFSSVAYGNKLFVAVGTKGLVYRSPDGTSWTKVEHSVTEDFETVFFYSNEFITPARLFIAVGKSGAVFTSADGLTWTQVAAPDSRLFARVYNGARDWFIAVSDSGTVLVSIDGEFWSRAWSGTNSRLISGSYAPGLFVSVGESGAIVALPDSEMGNCTYSFHVAEAPAEATLRSVAYCSGIFVAAGDSGVILSSADGLLWKREKTPTTNHLYGIAFGADRIVAVGAGGFLVSKTNPAVADSPHIPSDIYIGMRTASDLSEFQLASPSDEKVCDFSDAIRPPANNWVSPHPHLPLRGRTADDFTPPGWTILALDSGDLSNDGVPDFAFVLEDRDPARSDTADEDSDEPHTYARRILAVAFKDTENNRYSLAEQTNTFILEHDDPAREEPFSGLGISEGVLSLNYKIWHSMGSWSTTSSSYEFRYLNSEFTLVGATKQVFTRNTGETRDYTFDFTAKKYTTVTSNAFEDSTAVPRAQENAFSIEEPVTFKNYTAPFTLRIEELDPL